MSDKSRGIEPTPVDSRSGRVTAFGCQGAAGSAVRLASDTRVEFPRVQGGKTDIPDERSKEIGQCQPRGLRCERSTIETGVC